MNLPNSISSVVSHYRGNSSLREFAAQLSENLPEPISHQTISNWEGGVYKPSYYLMVAMFLMYNDWRRSLASEVLGILKTERPDLWIPRSNFKKNGG